MILEGLTYFIISYLYLGFASWLYIGYKTEFFNRSGIRYNAFMFINYMLTWYTVYLELGIKQSQPVENNDLDEAVEELKQVVDE